MPWNLFKRRESRGHDRGPDAGAPCRNVIHKVIDPNYIKQLKVEVESFDTAFTFKCWNALFQSYKQRDVASWIENGNEVLVHIKSGVVSPMPINLCKSLPGVSRIVMNYQGPIIYSNTFNHHCHRLVAIRIDSSSQSAKLDVQTRAINEPPALENIRMHFNDVSSQLVFGTEAVYSASSLTGLLLSAKMLEMATSSISGLSNDGRVELQSNQFNLEDSFIYGNGPLQMYYRDTLTHQV